MACLWSDPQWDFGPSEAQRGRSPDIRNRDVGDAEGGDDWSAAWGMTVRRWSPGSAQPGHGQCAVALGVSGVAEPVGAEPIADFRMVDPAVSPHAVPAIQGGSIWARKTAESAEIRAQIGKSTVRPRSCGLLRAVRQRGLTNRASLGSWTARRAQSVPRLSCCQRHSTPSSALTATNGRETACFDPTFPAHHEGEGDTASDDGPDGSGVAIRGLQPIPVSTAVGMRFGPGATAVATRRPTGGSAGRRVGLCFKASLPASAGGATGRSGAPPRHRAERQSAGRLHQAGGLSSVVVGLVSGRDLLRVISPSVSAPPRRRLLGSARLAVATSGLEPFSRVDGSTDRVERPLFTGSRGRDPGSAVSRRVTQGL